MRKSAVRGLLEQKQAQQQLQQQHNNSISWNVQNLSAMSGPTRYELVCHPLFLVISGGLNLPPFVLGIFGCVTWCSYYSSWLVGNACLTLLNMIAALYAVHKIRRTSHPPIEFADDSVSEACDIEKNSEGTESKDELSVGQDASQDAAPILDETRGCFSRLVGLRTISSDRIRHLICYDGVIATYSIIFFVGVFWISEGTERIRRLDWATEEELEGCVEFHERYMVTSLVFGFTYFSFVILAILASLCFR